MPQRRRRTVVVILLALGMLVGATYDNLTGSSPPFEPINSSVANYTETEFADDALRKLEIKGRAPKTGYKRSLFGNGWADINQCDVRNLVLQRDLALAELDEGGCKVLRGQLRDPYTAQLIDFVRGEQSSSKVQIDHVVALSDAWQKGAQAMSEIQRVEFANDALNLLAVDGPANQNKGDGDSATWLPPNKLYRCQYVARQVAVKVKYRLWVTQAEHDAIQRVLSKCPAQRLPEETKPA